MITSLAILFGGMALFVTIVGTMDVIGRRRQRAASAQTKN
jgi:hypothetical protein